MTTAKPSGGMLGDGVVMASEFAAVSLRIDHAANGPRLHVRDTESGVEAYLEPLELASFCEANTDEREAWLAVGAYRMKETP